MVIEHQSYKDAMTSLVGQQFVVGVAARPSGDRLVIIWL